MSLSSVAEHAIIETNTTAGLEKVLAVLVVETAKAQTYHWNVTGMAFGPLHALFQEIYEDHFSAQDELAERIKAIGGHADGRLSKSLETSSLDECDGRVTAREMVEHLANDQRLISASLTDLAGVAETENDIVTNDLAIARAAVHDKFTWMLRAHLEG
jgi:starvation-inducible DNA-binding protein